MKSSVVAVALAAATLAVPALAATSFQTLYSFSGGADGGMPNGGFVFDKAGNLYGTALIGGTIISGCPAGCGTVFLIKPSTGKATAIHAFTIKTDGNQPNGGLVADANGNIYGTTGFGGTKEGGTIFKYDPATNAFSTIHAFGGADGSNPFPLAVDSQGALYGVTYDGGKKNFGTLFKFVPKTGKSTVLHAFGTDRNEGEFPGGSLTVDGKGNVYGAMGGFGAHGAGTLFKFNLTTNTFTTVYAFTGGADGSGPTGSMQLGVFGNLVGMTAAGGASSNGTIFAFNPTTQGLTTRHSFTGGKDGAAPTGGLVLDSHGNPWGETTGGGTGYGTVFTLSPADKVIVLHAFGSGGVETAETNTGLTLFDGRAYGASPYGGTNNPVCASNSPGPAGCGTVFMTR